MKTPGTISATREKVLALLDSEPGVMRHALIGGEAKGHDDKLVLLSIHAGHVAAFIKDSDWLWAHLRNIYGFTAGWLMQLGEQRPQNVISIERDRQDELFVTGKLSFNCASRTAGPPRKLRVLMEEIGEVAEAIDLLENANGATRTSTRHLRSELVQVAAVAVAWLESLE